MIYLSKGGPVSIRTIRGSAPDSQQSQDCSELVTSLLRLEMLELLMLRSFQKLVMGKVQATIVPPCYIVTHAWIKYNTETLKLRSIPNFLSMKFYVRRNPHCMWPHKNKNEKSGFPNIISMTATQLP